MEIGRISFADQHAMAIHGDKGRVYACRCVVMGIWKFSPDCFNLLSEVIGYECDVEGLRRKQMV